VVIKEVFCLFGEKVKENQQQVVFGRPISGRGKGEGERREPVFFY